jgi:ComF family protein
MWRDLGQTLLDVLFPPRCAGCGVAGALLCAACVDSTRPPAEPLCPRCGRSLDADHTTRAAGPCPTCTRGEGPRTLDWIRSAARHEGAVRQAILDLKYRGQRRLAAPLGDVLARAVRQLNEAPEVIVPVPLHIERRRGRGFDQAHLLARRCAARLDIPCEAQVLLRQRATAPQVGLSAPARRANVAGAFTLAPTAPVARLRGRRILLLDDVTTTGSTLDAAADALKSVGPAALWGFAITRPDLADDARDLRVAMLSTREHGSRNGRGA